MGLKSSTILNLNPAPSLNWKTTPGNPYLDGDEITAEHNSIVFVHLEASETADLTLPKIDAASAGKAIKVVNLLIEKEQTGTVVLIADDLDTIEWTSPLDFFVYPAGFSDKCHFWLESNGVNRWSIFYPDSSASVLLAI